MNLNKKTIALSCLFAFVLSACSQEFFTELLGSVNTVANKHPFITSADEDKHQALSFIADMHADTANFVTADHNGYSMILGQKAGNDKREANDKGHLDLPRLVQGNVALQVFALINGASADQLSSDSFVTPIWDDLSQSYMDSEFTVEYWERNPDSNYFTGPADMMPYAQQYAEQLMPRPSVQYVLNVLGYPCEMWFTKKQGQDWHGSPWVEDWPSYAQDRLTYDVNGEQRCLASDQDINNDYHERWAEQLARTITQAAALSQQEQNKLHLIASLDDLNNLMDLRLQDKTNVGAMLATEGLYMENILNQADVNLATEQLFKRLYNQGFRILALTHFVDSEFGGSNTGIGDLSVNAPYGPYNPSGASWDGLPRGKKLGISEAGIKLVELMFEHGVVPDVAHASDGLLNAIIDLGNSYQKPIISSHSGFRVFNPQERNLTDEQVLRIAETGGVIGVGLSKNFVAGDQPIDVARAFRYLVDLIDNAQLHRNGDSEQDIIRGIDAVALGSDYDGGIEVTVDAAHLAAITRALTCEYNWFFTPNCLENNFSSQSLIEGEASDLAKIMGENTKRVLLQTLPQSTVQL